MENPLYERPRGLTTLEKSLKHQGWRLWGLLGVALSTLGLVIAGIEITKELKTNSNGLLTDTKGHGISTYQATTTFDIDDIIVQEQFMSLIPDMHTLTLNAGNITRGYRVDAWEVVPPDSFTIRTVHNHTLEFDGVVLSWDGWPISEVVQETTRSLKGWKDKFAKKVKKKLDSPLCNTEALVEQARGLKLIMAPACHAGVSAGKIFMHYNS